MGHRPAGSCLQDKERCQLGSSRSSSCPFPPPSSDQCRLLESSLWPVCLSSAVQREAPDLLPILKEEREAFGSLPEPRRTRINVFHRFGGAGGASKRKQGARRTSRYKRARVLERLEDGAHGSRRAEGRWISSELILKRSRIDSGETRRGGEWSKAERRRREESLPLAPSPAPANFPQPSPLHLVQDEQAVALSSALYRVPSLPDSSDVITKLRVWFLRLDMLPGQSAPLVEGMPR